MGILYRQYVGINTNMYLESLYKTIKYLYLEGKKCRRLDKSLNALLEFVKRQNFWGSYKVFKEQIIFKKYKDQREPEEAMILELEEGQWLVSSSTTINLNYLVEKFPQETNCSQESCHLELEPCNICIRSYRCSCLNNIHACTGCELRGGDGGISPLGKLAPCHKLILSSLPGITCIPLTKYNCFNTNILYKV